MSKSKSIPSYMFKALFAFLLLPLAMVYLSCTAEVEPVIVYVEPEIPELPEISETQYESLKVVYNPVIVAQGTNVTSSPEWRDDKSDQVAESPIRSMYRLSMPDGSAAPEGISIDPTTGEITVSESAPVTSPFGLELSVSVTYTSIASGDEVTITTSFRVVVRSVNNEIVFKEDMDRNAQGVLTIGDADNEYLYRIGGLSDAAGVTGDIVLIDASNNQEFYSAKGIPAVKFNVDLGTAGAIAIVGIGPPASNPIDIENLPETFRITLTVYTNGSEYSKSADRPLTNGTKGTMADYKAIYSWRDLSKIKDGNYELMNDIEFPDRGDFGFDNFKPIASFSGTLDGKGHTISKLFINRPNEDNVGLFSQLQTRASIKDVTIEHSGILGKDSVGALVGRIDEAGFEIENVHVYALGSSVVRGRGNNVGGLIGFARGDGSTSYIRRSSSHTPVYGSKEVGGMAGQFGILQSTGYADLIEFSGHTTGDVHGNDKTGGLFGLAINSKINGYATGNVKGNDDVGGLVGQARRVELNGYSTKKVLGRINVGGLIGNGNFEEEETGKVHGYALGFMSGKQNTGGLVGKLLLKDGGELVGYSRAKVQDYSMSSYTPSRIKLGLGVGKIALGLLVGSGDGVQVKGYYSMGESKAMDVYLNAVDGINGDPIAIGKANQADFEGFAFGAEPGEWTWVGEGKWPAINIGIQEGSEQPVEAGASLNIDLDFPSELQGVHRINTNTFKIAETRDADIYRVKFMTGSKRFDGYPTGLFIPAGGSVKVTVLENNGEDVPKLIVGEDRFWDAAKKHSLNKPVQTIKNTKTKSSLLYLRFATRSSIPDQIAVIKIEGAKPAPYLISGRTTTKEFQEQLNSLDYDLITMASDRFIYVMEKENIWKYKDQDWSMLAVLLDKMIEIGYGVNGVDGSSELHEIPPVRMVIQVVRSEPEEQVFPVPTYQLFSTPTFGIFVQRESAWQWIDVNYINKSWGLWHEMGHQFQVSPFRNGGADSGTQEVYVNVYSLAIERYFGGKSKMASAWNGKLDVYLNVNNRDDKSGAYFGGELNILQQLALYEQLRMEFGDDFFPRVHRYMRENRKDYPHYPREIDMQDIFFINLLKHMRENPKLYPHYTPELSKESLLPTDKSNEDFIKITSLVSGRNLGSFFKAWGYKDDYAIYTNEIITRLPDPPKTLTRQGYWNSE